MNTPIPLFDALSWGFVSVEADIWLYPDDGGNLRVAHDEVDDPTSLPTIEELYLAPLATLFTLANNGGIYADGTPMYLLVDIKSDGIETYSRLHEVLAKYEAANPGLFTTYTLTGPDTWNVSEGAIDVTISGDRPRDLMESQEVRYSTYDGRADDIGGGASTDFISLVSDNWNTFFGDFGWDGVGEMPEEIVMAIEDVVAEVHGEGRVLRFWNLPNDDTNVWGPLVDAGVDYVNTDNLPELSEFMRFECPVGHASPWSQSRAIRHSKHYRDDTKSPWISKRKGMSHPQFCRHLRTICF